MKRHHIAAVAALACSALALTACGAGSILGWAAQMTMSNFAAVGSLATRALPMLLLTILVFFNSPVWLMASTISRPRLWLALLFLTAIAGVFVVSVTADRVRPIMDADDHTHARSARLVGTPFETMPDPADVRPLRRTERLNVMFVVAASQLSQILIIAAMVALLFLVLGLILLSPELLAAWTRNGRSDGTVLGMTIPVPDSLIQVTFFLGALTFMYISARSAGDVPVERLVNPLHLIERNRRIVLADAEEAADSDHDGGDPAIAADDQLADIADLVVARIIDVEPSQLRRTPLTGFHFI